MGRNALSAGLKSPDEERPLHPAPMTLSFCLFSARCFKPLKSRKNALCLSGRILKILSFAPKVGQDQTPHTRSRDDNSSRGVDTTMERESPARFSLIAYAEGSKHQ